MIPDSSQRLLVFGSLHIDIWAELPNWDLLDPTVEQSYTQWAPRFGGTGANLAALASSLGHQVDFIATLGDDVAAKFACELFLRACPAVKLRPLHVHHSPTGIVILLFFTRSGERVRKVIGPTTSPIDEVADESLVEAFNGVPSGSTLLLDGYALRKRADAYRDHLSRMARRDIRICIELVPHEIWRFAIPTIIWDCLATVTHVSSSLSTIERLLQLPLESDRPSEWRVRRVSDAIPNSAECTIFHLRFGHRDAEFVAIGSKNSGWTFREYGINESVQTSRGDEQFLTELFPTSRHSLKT